MSTNRVPMQHTANTHECQCHIQSAHSNMSTINKKVVRKEGTDHTHKPESSMTRVRNVGPWSPSVVRKLIDKKASRHATHCNASHASYDTLKAHVYPTWCGHTRYSLNAFIHAHTFTDTLEAQLYHSTVPTDTPPWDGVCCT